MFVIFVHSMKMRMGEVDLTSDDVKSHSISGRRFKVHSKWIYGQAYYDVAVIHYTKGFAFDSHVQKICLPESPSEDYEAYKDQLARLFGNRITIVLAYVLAYLLSQRK